MTTRATRFLFSMLVLVVGMAVGSSAKATYDGTCTVDEVNFTDDTSGRYLTIHCNSGVFFYAYLKIDTSQTSTSACTLADGGAAMTVNTNGTRTFNTPSAAAVDDVKTWQAIAQAGYLSGRTVEIGYTASKSTCSFNLIKALGVH